MYLLEGCLLIVQAVFYCLSRLFFTVGCWYMDWLVGFWLCTVQGLLGCLVSFLALLLILLSFLFVAVFLLAARVAQGTFCMPAGGFFDATREAARVRVIISYLLPLIPIPRQASS